MSIPSPGPPWGQLAISWEHMLTTGCIHGPAQHILSSDVGQANFQSGTSSMSAIIHGIMFPTIRHLFVSGDFCSMLWTQSSSIGISITTFPFTHSFSSRWRDACVVFRHQIQHFSGLFPSPASGILNGSEGAY